MPTSFRSWIATSTSLDGGAIESKTNHCLRNRWVRNGIVPGIGILGSVAAISTILSQTTIATDHRRGRSVSV